MADESFQERTQQATPRRRQKARERGTVARSADLTAAGIICLGSPLCSCSSEHDRATSGHASLYHGERADYRAGRSYAPDFHRQERLRLLRRHRTSVHRDDRDRL